MGTRCLSLVTLLALAVGVRATGSRNHDHAIGTHRADRAAAAVRTGTHAAITGLTNEQWTFKPAPDRWSVGEVVEHIVLADALLFETAIKSLDGRPDPNWEATLSKTDVLKRCRTDHAESTHRQRSSQPRP